MSDSESQQSQTESHVQNAQQSLYPHQRRELALQIFIYSLGVFFLAALVGYVVILNKNPARFAMATSPRVPLFLWIGTAFLIMGSGSLELALRAVRSQKLPRFRKWIFASLFFGTLFCVFQSIGLKELLAVHFGNLTPISKNGANPVGLYQQSIGPYGLIASLVLLHVLHFLGGLIFLALVARNAVRNKYDHEYHSSVTLASSYWRFMDIVWIAMLGVFLNF